MESKILDKKRLPITSLHEFQGDFKTLGKKQFEKLKKSIEKNGFIQPFFIWNKDGKYYILDGHQRKKAIIDLYGDTIDVDCLEIKATSELEAKKFVLYYSTSYAEFDKDSFFNFADGLSFDDLEAFQFPGFSFSENDFLKGLDNDQDDEIPEVAQNELGVQLGDIYTLGEHRLMCGDSTDTATLEKLLNYQKMDVVFSDPPYGIDVVQSNQVVGSGSTKFGKIGGGKIVESNTYKKIIGDETTDCAKKFYQTCLDRELNNIIMWGGNYFTEFLPPSRCWIVWDKEMTGNFSEAEMAWTSFSKGGVKVFKHLWNGLSRKGERKEELSKRVHPTQKPVGLFVEIFQRFDGFKTIFDGFGGSGSTLIACEKTKRKCYMMELDPHYCSVIIKRWEKFTGQKAVKCE